MRVFCFKRRTVPGVRAGLLSIPENNIEKIESLAGWESVSCKVNGIEVDCSYDRLIELLADGDNLIKV